MEKKLVNDLSLHCNGNHLVVVPAVFSDQKSLMGDFIATQEYHPDAECY